MSSPDSSEFSRQAPMIAEDDPWLWLEEVASESSLSQVREWNAKTQKLLEADQGFAKLDSDILAIFDSEDRIPGISKEGDFYYNFWRARKNPRGLWRRTTLEEYEKQEPAWDVILDLDTLAAQESENWVWHGAQVLRPDLRRCLISLSRGGADASVTREFDLELRAFVDGGFYLPEAKGSISWIDADHVFVSTDFGPGSMTESGYPRVVKRWTRGTPLADAVTVYEAAVSDVSAYGYHDHSPGFSRDFVGRSIRFYCSELFLCRENGELVKIEAPDSATKGVFHEHLYIELRDPWEVGGRTFPSGALLIANFEEFLNGSSALEMVFEPDERTALAGFGFTKDYLCITTLEDVKNRVYTIRLGDPGWEKEPLGGVVTGGTVGIGAVDAEESNEVFLSTSDYLTPSTLSLGEIGQGSAPRRLKSLPVFFESKGLAVRQHFASSADGTRVPYFMIGREDLRLDGNNPTLLYGYGGFEIPLLPGYMAVAGRAWLQEGGVFVVANIRGGGEYGPRWHQAALKANRPKAYQDFAAVAEDLFARNITSPRRLGIQGGSNGGLLVGNMVTEYPDLFHAAVCQVPLLDMKRYSKLLAGASWVAEYGDPDKPEEWEFLRTFSPYHNVKRGVVYPKVLFTTSTRDDRVHPAHARKMAARMKEQGHEVLYYENIEGGHGGAADNKQAAYMSALAYVFLRQELF